MICIVNTEALNTLDLERQKRSRQLKSCVAKVNTIYIQLDSYIYSVI